MLSVVAPARAAVLRRAVGTPVTVSRHLTPTTVREISQLSSLATLHAGCRPPASGAHGLCLPGMAGCHNRSISSTSLGVWQPHQMITPIAVASALQSAPIAKLGCQLDPNSELKRCFSAEAGEAAGALLATPSPLQGLGGVEKSIVAHYLDEAHSLREVHRISVSVMFAALLGHVVRAGSVGVSVGGAWATGAIMGLAFVAAGGLGCSCSQNVTGWSAFTIIQGILKHISNESIAQAVLSTNLQRLVALHAGVALLTTVVGIGTHILAIHGARSSSSMGTIYQNNAPFGQIQTTFDVLCLLVVLAVIGSGTGFIFSGSHFSAVLTPQISVTPHLVLPHWYLLAPFGILRTLGSLNTGLAVVALAAAVGLTPALLEAHIIGSTVAPLFLTSAAALAGYTLISLTATQLSTPVNLGTCGLLLKASFALLLQQILNTSGQAFAAAFRSGPMQLRTFSTIASLYNRNLVPKAARV